MHFLNDDTSFPDVSLANKDGLLAIGGDLSEERLIKAYQSGIFPWFEMFEPILWWSPDPRFVLYPEKLVVSKSMRQILKNSDYIVTVNKAFEEVIIACSEVKRRGQSSSWITKEMIKAYCRLHELGYAKSVEAWQDKKLIGGLYGVEINPRVFCGESMFTKKSNASKIGLITFIQNTKYDLIDCQVYTEHMESLGAEPIPRETFLFFLK